jgi:membrane protein DedA with SNARE-associated domain
MPFWRFTVYTLLGCIPWVFLLGFIGEQVGANWTKWKDALHYVDYTVAVLIVVGIVYLVLRNRSRRGKDEAAADASA